jgi:hypothetical protein
LITAARLIKRSTAAAVGRRGHPSGVTRTSRGTGLGRATLVASIRDQSRELAADAAEASLTRQTASRDLTIATPTRTGGTKRQNQFLTLASTGRPRETEVRPQTLPDHGEPWDDERIERLAQDLADIRVQLEPKRTWPQAPLEPLADDTTRQRFLTLMERALDTLTSFPYPGAAIAHAAARAAGTRRPLVREPP